MEKDFESNKIKYQAFINKQCYRWKIFFDKEERSHIGDIALWKAMNDYNPEKSKFITFIGRKIEWEFLTTIRKEKRSEKKPVSLSLLMENEDFNRSLIPACLSSFDKDNLEDKDLVDFIKRKLNNRKKDIFVDMLSGKNLSEISKKMNISVQRVQQLVDQIKKTAAILNQEEYA